jgi:ADP-dependent NAD(P)H-hydrate dehydratase
MTEFVERIPRLPKRPLDSHKGQFGRVLVVAGSRGMSGAACLAGAAALRGGAGLVRVASPQDVWPIVASFEPSYLTFPLPSTSDGCVALEAVVLVERLASENDVVALGPGLGTGSFEFIRAVVPKIARPLVLDADGLNALVGHLDLLQQRPAPTIVTPHPGEMARLLGKTTAEIQLDRSAWAQDFATRFHCVTILKGWRTVVTDGLRLYINSTGNPGMATGGTGDVLTGLAAALWAQKKEPFEAAVAAVYAHGKAGDFAAAGLGQTAQNARDLLDHLPAALSELEESEEEELGGSL